MDCQTYKNNTGKHKQFLTGVEKLLFSTCLPHEKYYDCKDTSDTSVKIA